MIRAIGDVRDVKAILRGLGSLLLVWCREQGASRVPASLNTLCPVPVLGRSAPNKSLKPTMLSRILVRVCGV